MSLPGAYRTICLAIGIGFSGFACHDRSIFFIKKEQPKGMNKVVGEEVG
jgi:hypothetical protein